MSPTQPHTLQGADAPPTASARAMSGATTSDADELSIYLAGLFASLDSGFIELRLRVPTRMQGDSTTRAEAVTR